MNSLFYNIKLKINDIDQESYNSHVIFALKCFRSLDQLVATEIGICFIIVHALSIIETTLRLVGGILLLVSSNQNMALIIILFNKIHFFNITVCFRIYHFSNIDSTIYEIFFRNDLLEYSFTVF